MNSMRRQTEPSSSTQQRINQNQQEGKSLYSRMELTSTGSPKHFDEHASEPDNFTSDSELASDWWDYNSPSENFMHSDDEEEKEEENEEEAEDEGRTKDNIEPTPQLSDYYESDAEDDYVDNHDLNTG